jgi:hypothetical protein
MCSSSSSRRRQQQQQQQQVMQQQVALVCSLSSASTSLCPPLVAGEVLDILWDLFFVSHMWLCVMSITVIEWV